ncbi:MAG: phosphoribosylamine--glycine ligase [Oscillospiraceae bacterium]|nr:phosphoribosylamine--glycine ligase [Oscillospiraceae bacterium]
MKIMVVGGGGREHAIIKALRKNLEITEIFALPGNGGIAADAICADIAAKDLSGITAFARERKIDFAVVAPDDPLVLGAVDLLDAIGIPCFGPNQAAAAIEGSKVFSKNLMKKYGIPTARFEVFRDPDKAVAYLKSEHMYPAVIKADGLALGKGVLIAENEAEAVKAVHTIMTEKAFGESGNQVVVEEFLTGPEVSVLSFTDGETIVPMVSSMDHKRAFDHDRGPNTGGMGAIAPNPFYTEDIQKTCMETIFLPTIQAMKAEGRPFKGCLYFGLMLTPDGPRVIEYNCRFGDPEAQVVLPLLKTDLLTIMQAVSQGKLNDVNVEFDSGAACCVVAASGGYPVKYERGYPVSFGRAEYLPDVTVFHAGTKKTDSGLVTSGGRVLGVTATGPDLPRAIEKAYAAMNEISFKDMFYRWDIGGRCG